LTTGQLIATPSTGPTHRQGGQHHATASLRGATSKRHGRRAEANDRRRQATDEQQRRQADQNLLRDEEPTATAIAERGRIPATELGIAFHCLPASVAVEPPGHVLSPVRQQPEDDERDDT
jgi:hypothetical protein